MEQGPVEQKIISDCVKYNVPLPDKIANAPRLEIGLSFYFNAFSHLTTCRNIGQVEGPIPWDKIEFYGIRKGLDEEELIDLHFYIRSMDDEFLQYRLRKMKASNPPKA